MNENRTKDGLTATDIDCFFEEDVDGVGDIVELKEKIDYTTLGQTMKRIRKAHRKTQAEAAEIFHVSRTVYTKYENGTVRPNREVLQVFADVFGISFDELLKKVSVAIPDTCALLKNKRLLNMLLEDYDKVIIPKTVMMELSCRKNLHNKDKGGRMARVAWQILANINYYLGNFPDRVSEADNLKLEIPKSVTANRNLVNDYRVMALAKKIEKKAIGEVIIIHDDVDFTVYGSKAIRVDDYVAKRSKLENYELLLGLDKEFDDLERFEDLMSKLDINAYLPDGMTLLINTIRCNDPEKCAARNDEAIPWSKISRKLKFLYEHGADIDKNDNGQYCHPPISHSIQIKQKYGYDIFRLLLMWRCDFNKGARDEQAASYLKAGKLNEGNTPLMIACFLGKAMFVRELCRNKGISVNQQDSNGYTALMKCAVQRYNRISKCYKHDCYDSLYEFLSAMPSVDTLIRDRNNHTADDWWKRGDDCSYREDDLW